MMTTKTFGMLMSALAIAGLSAPLAHAEIAGLAHHSTDVKGIARIHEGAGALAPFSYIRFCASNPEDCRPSPPETLQWNRATEAVVAAANRSVNKRMRPKGEAGDTWSAGGSSGDCEDFALTKRRELLSLGIPGSALRMAVAVTPDGEGHAVLVVSSSAGDLVLDNRNNRLLPWHKTGLSWQKIASAENPRIWLSAF